MRNFQALTVISFSISFSKSNVSFFFGHFDPEFVFTAYEKNRFLVLQMYLDNPDWLVAKKVDDVL